MVWSRRHEWILAGSLSASVVGSLVAPIAQAESIIPPQSKNQMMRSVSRFNP